MIEDADGNSLGMLIDWEFTVTITPENTYTIGGTGTILFMSWRLLQQVKKILVSDTAKKGASSSSPLAIEFICIKYSGPLGVECHLNPSKAWLPHAWSNWNIGGCFENKVAFYTVGEGDAALQAQFDGYFKDLIPLALEWMDLLRLNFPVQIGSVDGQVLHRPIEFDALLKILDKHITELLKGKPELAPERLLRKRLVDKHKQDVHASGEIMKPQKDKGKCKVVESGIPALTGQGKKVWTADEVGLVSLQLSSDVNALPICRSGRPGAGTGGRNAQLEKVGAALVAPTWTSQPKGSTTLGRGSHPQKPPPPYSISNGTGTTVMSSLPPVPPVNIPTPGPTPCFLIRSIPPSPTMHKVHLSRISPATSARPCSTLPTLPLCPSTPYPFHPTLSGVPLLRPISLPDPTPTPSAFPTHAGPSVPLVFPHPTISSSDRLTGPLLD
ncbi:uncharacterized protein EDB91DRAFT_1249089 [Suillus paluster]|uniref:uncharacterized protein n=1 Tax=Suillus paluster TaxID=48578 RepID=UPI001B87AFBF|nr:uncharacterized protein EDB91DRAFT_1249089 [Suillus paluster]KAG1738914.1 hypothetical protein EDB91DRAFT_1249089 [Suillus paluster]